MEFLTKSVAGTPEGGGDERIESEGCEVRESGVGVSATPFREEETESEVVIDSL